MSTITEKIATYLGRYKFQSKGLGLVLEAIDTDIHLRDSQSVHVHTVAELEAAVAAQVAGQFIFIDPGTYQLTAALTIPMGATGGGLIGVGQVEILGLTAATSAILIDSTLATGVFEYTFGGVTGIKGGVNKIGLRVINGAGTKKTIIYINDSVHFEDNGSGIGLSVINTGSDAMRIYACCDQGTGWDTVLFTCKLASDKFHIRGVSFDTTMTLTAVSIAANFWFESCKVPLAGAVVGGNATMVCNIVNCYTNAAGTVTAVNSTTDFPDFSPTVV